MKHILFSFFFIFSTITSLYSQTSVDIKVMPDAYIKNATDKKMGEWMKKRSNESSESYKLRTSIEKQNGAKKQFTVKATDEYKNLIIKNTNWNELQLGDYNKEQQAFLIKSVVAENFMMPVSEILAEKFRQSFYSFNKTEPDFSFENNQILFKKLTFISPDGTKYTYDKNDVKLSTNEVTYMATIDWDYPLLSRSNTKDKDLDIKACIKSDSRIKSVSVFVNGHQMRGISAVKNDGCNFSVNQTLSLSEGPNVIKIMAENESGQFVSDERYVSYAAEKVINTSIDKRLALIIGNAAYEPFSLANPVNDATDVAKKLESLGFEVILSTNNTLEEMENAIDNFGQKAERCNVALFYYAGHALQYNGNNYLMPVDVDLKSESDIKFRCSNIDRVLAKMEDAQCQFKLVILDACRNNPFNQKWRGNNNQGLNYMEAPTGTFIAYSTSPNKVARDGIGRNSPYTEELLKKLDVKNLKIEELFKQVREEVFVRTNKEQIPWELSSMIGEFYFNK